MFWIFWPWGMWNFSFMCVCVRAQSPSHVWLFETRWTAAHQAPPVHGISQERILDWVAKSPSRRSIFPTQGSNPRLLHWQVDSLPLSHQGSLKPTTLAPWSQASQPPDCKEQMSDVQHRTDRPASQVYGIFVIAAWTAWNSLHLNTVLDQTVSRGGAWASYWYLILCNNMAFISTEASLFLSAPQTYMLGIPNSQSCAFCFSSFMIPGLNHLLSWLEHHHLWESVALICAANQSPACGNRTWLPPPLWTEILTTGLTHRAVKRTK